MSETTEGKPIKRRLRILLPVGVKLIILVTIILTAALVIMNKLVSEMVYQDLLITAEEENYTINNRTSVEVEYRLNNIRRDAYILLDFIRVSGRDSALARQGTELFFERSHEVAALIVPEFVELINHQYFLSREADPGQIPSWVLGEGPSVDRAKRGEPVFSNPSGALGLPLTAMFYPWQENGYENAAIILFSPEGMAELFGTGHNSSFLVNAEGEVLVHTDYRMILNNSDISGHPLLREITSTDAMDIKYIYNEGDVRFFGAGRKLSMGGLVLMTSIEYDLPFERTTPSIQRNTFLIISVIFVLILLLWFLGKTITTPVQQLTKAVSLVAAGDFNVRLAYSFPDEIGVLFDNFNKMGRALIKRDQFMDAFSRYTNPEIVSQLKNSEIALIGEKRQAAVLYAGIFSFLDSNQELLSHNLLLLLNDYFAKMNAAIEKGGGIVDHASGEKLMAVWGAPLSMGSTEADAFNCVLTAIQMRSALLEFNARAERGKQKKIRIGCGIDTGEVVAGQFGIFQRKEYSVIGYPADFASNIAALNLEFGTDILISENTWNYIGDKFIVEEVPHSSLWKAEPFRIFAVIDVKADVPENQKGPKTLAEVRELLEIAEPDGNV